MTVQELIEELKKFALDTRVAVLDYEYGDCDISEVVYDQDEETVVIKS